MPIPTPEERVGQRVGDKYLLRSIIGRGGMGVVYEAEHTWTGRAVAVKLLLPELARDEAVARRFLQEARAAARLAHPSVVDVLDMGTTDESTVYMVLELLQGEPLSRRVKRLGQLSVDECLELLVPILEALAEAHAAGVTHRDLKPDNIFVSRGPHGAVLPKLLDFGVARVTDERGGSDMATRTGQPIGTPWYMAPEQARGERDVGPAADLWAMAVVLYQCLSGVLPFHADSALGTLHLIVRGGHEHLSSAAPWVPAAVARVVERGLSVDPLLRHRDAHAFAAALLEACGRTAPVRTGQPALAPTVLAVRDDAASVPGALTAPTLDGTHTAPPQAMGPNTSADSARESYEPARQTTAGGAGKPRLGWLLAAALSLIVGAAAAWMTHLSRGSQGRPVASDVADSSQPDVAALAPNETHRGALPELPPDTVEGMAQAQPPGRDAGSAQPDVRASEPPERDHVESARRWSPSPRAKDREPVTPASADTAAAPSAQTPLRPKGRALATEW